MVTSAEKFRLRAAAAKHPADQGLAAAVGAVGGAPPHDKSVLFVAVGATIAVVVVAGLFVGVKKLSQGGFSGYASWKATTFAHAFALNSVAVAFALGITTGVSSALTHRVIERGDISEWASSALSVLTAGVATFLSYFLLYVIFGFGGGMLTSSGPKEPQLQVAAKLLNEALGPQRKADSAERFVKSLASWSQS